MACFENLITVDDTCDDQTSESGLTLKDIGISIDFLDSINSDYSSGKELAQSKIDFALKQIPIQITSKLSKFFRANTIIDERRVGFTQDNLNVKAGANMRGVQIELCNQNSYVDFFLSTLSVQLTANGAVNILVYDLLQNKLLDTLPITAIANEIVTIYPNKTYKSDRKRLNIALLYDASSQNSINTLLTQSGCSGCGGSTNYISRYVEARGVEIPAASAKTQENLTGVSHTSGITFTYSINCNHSDWLCDKRNQIAEAVLYRAASEIYRYGVANSRRFTTETTAEVERMTMEMNDYENRYNRSLEDVLRHIKLPNDRKCFDCDKPLMYLTGAKSLPA